MENIKTPCHSKDNIIAEIYKNIAVVTKHIHAGKVMESFQDIWAKTKDHQNNKVPTGFAD